MTAGRRFNSTQSWYPASGLRDLNNGTLLDVTTYGYYWSASPHDDSSSVRRLGFYSTGVNPAYGYHRSYGFPVRCVQE